MLIPFQQVQLNDLMNHIKRRSIDIKKRTAKQLVELKALAKSKLEKLEQDGIIFSDERELLSETVDNIDEYILEKDSVVSKEVLDMGDEGYVALSDRLRAQFKEEYRQIGLEEGRAEGRTEGRTEAQEVIILRILSKGHTVEEAADLIGLPVAEIQEIADKALVLNQYER